MKRGGQSRPSQTWWFLPTTDDQRGRLVLNTQLLHFLVVVFAVEDVPLLAAFQDGLLLVLDFLPRQLVDFRFLVEQTFQNLASLKPNRIAVFQQVDLGHFSECVADYVGELVHLVAAQPHRTALYFFTSSVFTLRNISW